MTDTELPPLPQTDDPYALLGVEPDADLPGLPRADDADPQRRWRSGRRRDLRPRMLGVMMRFGVTLDALQHWIHEQMDPVLGLPRYSWWIDGDAGLRLAGLLAVRIALDAEDDDTVEDC